MMIMDDATPEECATYADEIGLTFPVLSDLRGEIFARWNTSGAVPSTTILDRGMVVSEIDITWYQDKIEEYVYGDGR